MSKKQDKRVVDRDQWFRVFMPYTYQKLEGAHRKHFYLPLNNDYKPLGVRCEEEVDYDAYAVSHGVIFRSDPKGFKNVWVGKALYLYSGHPASLKDYTDRVARLLSRTMKLERTSFH